MKTVINAKIIFERENADTDIYHTVDLITVRSIRECLKSGSFELVDVIGNELMNEPEITLVIKDKKK